MNKIFLIVGVPASGKSTIAAEVVDRFTYVPHDDYKERIYPSILLTATAAGKPVLGEIPFGVSKIQASLLEHGCEVVPVYLLEDEDELRRRWDQRGMKNPSTRQGHLSRQHTYRARAKETGAFSGGPAEVLEFLKGAVK